MIWSVESGWPAARCIHPRSSAKRHWSCSSPGAMGELLVHRYCTERISDLGLNIRAWPVVDIRSILGDRQGSLPHLSEQELQELASAIWAGYHTGSVQPCHTILLCWEASVHPQRDVLFHLPAPPQKKWECVRNLVHLFCVEINNRRAFVCSLKLPSAMDVTLEDTVRL